MEIAETLKGMGVDVAIPLFEETVEWAGAINSMLMDNPALYGQSLLLRDKALMKLIGSVITLSSFSGRDHGGGR